MTPEEMRALYEYNSWANQRSLEEYHRGQMAGMLRQLGATPKATDLIAFYREHGSAANASTFAR